MVNNHYYYFLGFLKMIKLLVILFITFIYLLALFIVGCAIFEPKMAHLLPPPIFFWKIINILIYLLAPFILQNF